MTALGLAERRPQSAPEVWGVRTPKECGYRLGLIQGLKAAGREPVILKACEELVDATEHIIHLTGIGAVASVGAILGETHKGALKASGLSLRYLHSV